MDFIFYYQMLILFGFCIATIIVIVLCAQFFAEQDLRKKISETEKFWQNKRKAENGKRQKEK